MSKIAATRRAMLAAGWVCTVWLLAAPPALGAANSFGQRSMGHLETLHTYTLVDTEDVDAALKAHDTVTSPPG